MKFFYRIFFDFSEFQVFSPLACREIKIYITHIKNFLFVPVNHQQTIPIQIMTYASLDVKFLIVKQSQKFTSTYERID